MKWDETSGVSLETHKSYLEKFADDFLNGVKQLIDRKMRTPHFLDSLESSNDKKLLGEVLNHAYFCKENAERYQQRNELITPVIDFIKSENKMPFIVYGESGSGKTSVLAKIAYEV